MCVRLSFGKACVMRWLACIIGTVQRWATKKSQLREHVRGQRLRPRNWRSFNNTLAEPCESWFSFACNINRVRICYIAKYIKELFSIYGSRNNVIIYSNTNNVHALFWPYCCLWLFAFRYMALKIWNSRIVTNDRITQEILNVTCGTIAKICPSWTYPPFKRGGFRGSHPGNIERDETNIWFIS